MNFHLELHETPPSLNRYAGGPRGPYFREKAKWQKQISTALMAAGVPRGLGKVTATATMTFPTRRKRDEGNLRFLLEKALGDALVKGGWIEDDTGDCFSFGRIEFDAEPGDALTRIELDVKSDRDSARANRRGEASNAQRESNDRDGVKPRRWRRRVKG